MKYKLIFKTFGSLRRGANTTSHYLRDIVPELELVDIKNVSKITNIRDNSTLVFVSQAPILYGNKYNFTKSKPTDVFYIRHDKQPELYDKMVITVNNGFSHSHYKGIQYFSPFLYNYSSVKHKEVQEITLGYYVRAALTPDSYNWFLKFLNNLPFKVNLITMGEQISYSNVENVITHTHTFDNNKFFKSVSHYI